MNLINSGSKGMCMSIMVERALENVAAIFRPVGIYTVAFDKRQILVQKFLQQIFGKDFLTNQQTAYFAGYFISVV